MLLFSQEDAMSDLSDIQAAESVKIIGATIDGTEATPVRSTATGDLGTSDTLHSGGVQAASVVGIAAVEAKVGGSRWAYRKSVTIHPTDRDIYWGLTNAVTVSSGTPIYKKTTASFAVEDMPIYLIAAGNTDVRITEGA
jgi:hypothetical protein